MTEALSDSDAPFWDHVQELRQTILVVVAIIALTFLGCLVAHRPLLRLLTAPLSTIEQSTPLSTRTVLLKRIDNRSDSEQFYQLPSNGEVIRSSPFVTLGKASMITIPSGGFVEIETIQEPSLAILSPADGMTTALRVSFWAALAISAPLWLVRLLRFIAPGLREGEQRLAPLLIGSSVMALLVGLYLGLSTLVPFANRTLYAFNESIGTNLWSVSQYLTYTIVLLAGSTLACQAAAILLLLIYFDRISAQTLIVGRRLAIVVIFFCSALLTPPDVVSQLAMAFPLIGLYEVAVLYARLKS